MSVLRLTLAALAAAFVLTAGVLLATRDGDAGRSGRGAPAAVALGAPSRPAATTEQRIARLTAAVRARPRSADGYTALAGAWLQKARETADPDLYGRADRAVRRSLALRPNDPAALSTRGMLRLSLHDFRGALADARQALAAAPDLHRPRGVLVDALIELGRYRAAARELQTMVDRRPDLDAYTRVAHLRELTGDLAGAARALDLAVAAGGEAPENTAFAAAQLGNVGLARNRPRAAVAAYRTALATQPGYAPAEAGLARAAAARGRHADAIRRLRRLVARLPLPQHVAELGEIELAAGRPAAARRDLALLGAQHQLLRAAGIRTDAVIALHEADHGDPRRAVRLARASWAGAPSVRSADALGWALTRAGRPREGVAWARRARRLGSADPLFAYHAGIAARAAGRGREGRRLLRSALAHGLAAHPWQARAARRALGAAR
jgi:tetratricopeptide (TPR) repeat protein